MTKLQRIIRIYDETVHVVTWVSLWSALASLGLDLLMFYTPFFTWLPTSPGVVGAGGWTSGDVMKDGFAAAPACGLALMCFALICLGGAMLGGLRRQASR